MAAKQLQPQRTLPAPQLQVFSSCSTRATSDTSTALLASSNTMSKSALTNTNISCADPSIPLAQHKDALAKLDAEALARQRAEVQLAEARSRIQYLERQLAAYAPQANKQFLHHRAPPVVVASQNPLVSVNSAVIDTNNRHITAQPAKHSQGAPIQGQHQVHNSACPQQKPSPSPQQQPTQVIDHQTQSQHSQEKEILSHCSDISNCNKVTNSNGNGSAGGGSYNSQNVSNETVHTSSKKANTSIVNSTNGISKRAKSKKERPVKIKIPGQSRYWTPDEHKLFLEALQKFGHKDLRSISNYVGTRNMTQVRTHSQKYFMRLMREAKRQNPGCKTITDTNNNALSKPINSQNSKQHITDSNTRNITASSNSNNNTSLHSNSENKNGLSRSGIDESDKYSVPNTCGMTLLCLVGEDTRV